MTNIFQRLELEAFRKGITPRTQESMKWFRQRAASLNSTTINRKSLMNEEPLKKVTRPEIGKMYMFFYDPKYKETLPYYDTFPLIVMVGPAEKGFYGVNLHYIPPVLRAKMLDGLMDVTNNKAYDDSTKFRVSYEMLKGMSNLKYFKPCFKHYLTQHLKSSFSYIPPPEWEVAAFLPTASFKKASASEVYKISKDLING